MVILASIRMDAMPIVSIITIITMQAPTPIIAPLIPMQQHPLKVQLIITTTIATSTIHCNAAAVVQVVKPTVIMLVELPRPHLPPSKKIPIMPIKTIPNSPARCAASKIPPTQIIPFFFFVLSKSISIELQKQILIINAIYRTKTKIRFNAFT